MPAATPPDELPVMPLRSTIVFPTGVISVQIGMPQTLELLAAYPTDEHLLVALVIAPGGPDDPIDPKTLRKTAALARVSDRLNLPGGSVQATVQGLRRIQIVDAMPADGYLKAKIRGVRETGLTAKSNADLITRILVTLETLANEVERISKEIPRLLRMNIANASRFADLVATLANFSVSSKDEVLQRLSIPARLRYVLGELEQQNQRARQLEKAAPPAAEKGAESPARRASDLRNQIKVLQTELGEIDPVEREAVNLLNQIEAAGLPARAATAARIEVERLRVANPSSSESGEIRSYLDWLLHMPWNRFATRGPQSIDLARVQAALDEEHLDLEEPKERLLDYLAVARLRGDLRGPIPCLVGPPGVGKTTLVEALARGLGRPLARLELGGRGESQLVGVRRTRAAASPGKIVETLRDVEVADPVLLLEEMDEIGLGKVEGDPIETMEEALRWDGRNDFTDRYLDIAFPLGDVLFVATAQDFYRIPRDLRKLMVEIRIAGYTPEEKVDIVRERLLARLVEEHGLEPGDVAFDDEALSFLTRSYARDAGLGLLRRSLATLLRTRARAKARGDKGCWRFTPEKIEEILGLPRYVTTAAENAPEVGVVTGLAWTAAGGELMFIEALKMPGTGRLIITGLLGDVMRESVSAAYSYVRSRGDELGITEDEFKDADVHVHFPVGAIPKDGPSAGIAVTLAIASTLSNRPVRHDIAMTGEVTLRGKVLEVGGIKEKVLAASRAGLRRLILPLGNERDFLREVPEDVRAEIEAIYVSRMEEVVELALIEQPGQEQKPTARRRTQRATSPKAARRRGG
jgi:ATP-dependent Lon protease